ncbi:hypothetical protein ACH5RR_018216 [Cinchona calisaya]|uniref:Uncharacterized protein n=1 Tax=Cinchona calisaya TaxID=153742 RepID=A0ABD2ZPI8_9GENT
MGQSGKEDPQYRSWLKATLGPNFTPKQKGTSKKHKEHELEMSESIGNQNDEVNCLDKQEDITKAKAPLKQTHVDEIYIVNQSTSILAMKVKNQCRLLKVPTGCKRIIGDTSGNSNKINQHELGYIGEKSSNPNKDNNIRKRPVDHILIDTKHQEETKEEKGATGQIQRRYKKITKVIREPLAKITNNNKELELLQKRKHHVVVDAAEHELEDLNTQYSPQTVRISISTAKSIGNTRVGMSIVAKDSNGNISSTWAISSDQGKGRNLIEVEVIRVALF